MDYINMPREQFVDQLLYAMRQGLTMEMYDKLRAALRSVLSRHTQRNRY